MTCTVPRCDTPTADGIYLCDQAEGDLFTLLGQIPDTLTDAQDTIARLERKGQTTGGSASGHSDGLSIDALDHVITLKKLLESWAQMLREETQEAASEDPAHYLRANLRQITQHDWAGDMLTELTEAHRTVQNLVDTRREVIILRRCGTLLEDGTHCQTQLRLRDKDDEWVKCRNCGSWFAVEAVRRDMARKAKGEPMRAADVRRYLSRVAGQHIQKKDMENWVQNRRLAYVLERVETSARPRRAYFPGDVLHLHLEMRMRRHNGRVAHNDV